MINNIKITHITEKKFDTFVEWFSYYKKTIINPFAEERTVITVESIEISNSRLRAIKQEIKDKKLEFGV